MPAKKTEKKRAPKVEFQGYLNVNLTTEQDAEFDAWFVENPDVFSLLFDQLDFGYKIAFSEDEFNDGIAVTLYAKSSKLSWAGWTLTAWAATIEEAAALLYFKHHFVCDRDWDKFRGTPTKSHARRG